MGFVMAIAPVVIMGGIVVLVIERLKYKSDQGELCKKKSKGTQAVLDSLIPIGMLFGGAIGLVFSMLFSVSHLYSISVGAGIGYLIGYFAYEFFSRKENN